MHYCPVCCKGFETTFRCQQHLAQPRGACHNHLKTHPSILKAGRIARDNPTEIPLFPSAMEDPSLPEDDPPLDHFSVEDNYPPPNPEAPYRENYTGAARKHDDKGPTFMDNFWSDPKADERKSNIFFPFASSEEWEFASWLLKANLPLAITDEFLKLRLVKTMLL